MNEKVLRVLEYNKVITALTEKATSEPGKLLCNDLKPMTEIEAITEAQIQTQDALSRLFKKGAPSFRGNRNILGMMKSLEIGSILSAGELLKIAAILECSARIKSYGRNEKDDSIADSLENLFDGLEPVSPLSSEIRRCILAEDEISDDASPTLKHIRRSIILTNEKIHQQLTQMVNGSHRTYLQDAVITMRNNRYCIPVKSEYKNQVPGMIHDQSQTGSTLFIEPASVVSLNNQIKELSLQEEAEIEVILSVLSVKSSDSIEQIRQNYNLLTQLDFIFAKAALALDQNATMPIMNSDHRIVIRKGRHPLLNKSSVVPIDIELGNTFDLLVVTGPNTGGKTVSLKTVGLLTLMGQAGLHIPALDRSELSLFHEVYADIGDEQSIEQSLSTFSSHMTNIVSILKEADSNSLCLFDELGAGTDPTEGAALAIAILKHLHQRGIRTAATTHYSELKLFALSTPGVENASCEFDVETLRPTYRLLIGIPGKSNAFAISSKLGLPDYIVASAKNELSQEDESFEDIISDLEKSRKTIETERLEIAAYKKEVESLKLQLSQKQERLDQAREKILREANEKARDILQEAKEIADESIREFQKNNSSVTVKDMEQSRQKLRNKINEKNSNLTLKPSETVSKKPLQVKLGDTVKIVSMGLKGSVHSLPDQKGNLFIQCGIMRTQANIKDLIRLDDEDITQKLSGRTSTGKMKLSKTSTISMEINLLGRTVDEALAELDKYLDDAYLSHLPSVRIVHGKGTGALRNAVHQHLRKAKYVESFRLGEFGEGDAGVTIAIFKK